MTKKTSSEFPQTRIFSSVLEMASAYRDIIFDLVEERWSQRNESLGILCCKTTPAILVRGRSGAWFALSERYLTTSKSMLDNYAIAVKCVLMEGLGIVVQDPENGAVSKTEPWPWLGPKAKLETKTEVVHNHKFEVIRTHRFDPKVIVRHGYGQLVTQEMARERIASFLALDVTDIEKLLQVGGASGNFQTRNWWKQQCLTELRMGSGRGVL